jgi:hypothetical protein
MAFLRLLVVTAALAAGTAHAVDYTLNVPVKVTSLADGVPLEVECWVGCVMNTPGCATGDPAAVSAFGYARKTLTVVNGGYSGTATLTLSLTDAQAGLKLSWGCSLRSNTQPVPASAVKVNSNSVLRVGGSFP